MAWAAPPWVAVGFISACALLGRLTRSSSFPLCLAAYS